MSGQVVAVIPARYSSQRFPGKPLARIAGVPMILRVLDNVAAAQLVDRVLVATDDERIATVVREAGGRAVMTPTDLPSGSDRVWAAARDEQADIVVNVQGDEPLLPPHVVDALVEQLFDDEGFDLSTPVISVPRLAATAVDVVSVARDDAGAALYFSRSVIPFGADPVWRHVGVYAYRRPALERYVQSPPTILERSERLEQLRALSLGLRVAAVEIDAPTHAVDRPSDVPVVERLLVGTPVSGPGAAVSLVVLDVDGVLTEGHISYLGTDEQVLTFDVKDGFGIVALLRAGIQVALLSARDSPALRRRASELGIFNVRAGVHDKAAELRELTEMLGVSLTETCYVGDDQPDVLAMGLAGLSAAPADASPAALAQATLILSHSGGRGAVRELAETLLAARWPI
jgi:3-deoxy-manno-octulosonate cytidylyltransferase (CMP-KDO synthetase)